MRPQSELDRLRVENLVLRRKLAHTTAQYIWTEGGSFSKINSEIAQYGFKLKGTADGTDPRIVPIDDEQDTTKPSKSKTAGGPSEDRRHV